LLKTIDIYVHDKHGSIQFSQFHAIPFNQFQKRIDLMSGQLWNRSRYNENNKNAKKRENPIWSKVLATNKVNSFFFNKGKIKW